MKRSSWFAWIVALPVGLVLACGAPRGECEGELIYLDGSCRRCPEDARFDHDLGTCVCEPEDAYEYRPDNTCALRPGAMPPGPMTERDAAARDDDAGAEDTGTSTQEDPCPDYCEFLSGCVAQNAAAAAAAASVIEQLGVSGEDVAPCTDACQAQPNDGSNAVAACMAEMRMGADCDGKDDLGGIQAALAVIDDCCVTAPSSGLCLDMCEALAGAPVAASMVTFCN